MLFTEPRFLFLFLPTLLVLSFAPAVWAALRRRAGRHASYANVLLVAASTVFYAQGAGAFTALMAGSIAFNYAMAVAIDRARRSSARAAKRWLVAAIGVNLAVLAWFKYAAFLASSLAPLAKALGAAAPPVPTVVLPIGISFFTFHAISYVVDVYRREAVAQKSPLHAALYMLLFPQLIAGPIIRYRTIAAQLRERLVTLDDFAEGVRRFIVGFGKKVLIANVVAVPADQIFALPPDQLTAPLAWLALLCYSLQIYFDFSGYSDMAIGLGRLFGFRFPENFAWPYVAQSVQDFWRRWHLSLSSWFRDYVYVPLGGNRRGEVRTYVNLVTVFFLCGLWHGANWTFVVWGLFHGTFLVVERLGLGLVLEAVWRPARHIYTLSVVAVGWVFFRADSLTHAFGMLRALAGAGGSAPTPYTLAFFLTNEVFAAVAVGVVGATPWLPLTHASTARWPAWARVPVEITRTAALAAVMAAALIQIAANTYNPFIYFRF